MKSINKPVQFSEHAKEQLHFRGSNEEEVLQATHNAKWKPAEFGRMECTHEFSFNKEWNGKFYKRKQVRPIFVEEDNIVIVTVYVYYS